MTDTTAPDLIEQARVAFDRAFKCNIKGLGYDWLQERSI